MATTTTTKMIKSLQTERITPEETTGEGTGDGVEAKALLVLPPHGLSNKGAGRRGSLAGMGDNSVHRERGG